ncbi:hypothetical protein RYH80_12855 [Halobaculum sp. MBLA0147]|uniref:hypothetical protein n=1 Tax=Halobaculum sp. MBLA0147 TaxID=3079934 RepID=UPI00352645EA
MDKDTRRAVSSVIARLIPVGIAIGLALWNNNIGITIAVVFAVVSLVVAIPVEYVLTYSPAVSYRDKQLSTFFSRYLKLVEADIESVAHGDVDVRANIMRLSSDGLRDSPSYKVAFYAREADYADEEFELEFDIGQGCVGKVHEARDQKFAISPHHHEAWGEGWSTSDRHDRVTEDLNTIIGTPVFDPEKSGKEPIAVLIIDSEDPIEDFVSLGEDQTLEDVSFKGTDVADRATDHASDVGILL